MSASQSDEPDRTGRTKRRILTCAAAAAAFMLVGSVAWACIPWAGEFGVSNLDSEPGQRSTTVWGADHTDVDSSGNTGEDRGNGQGMVWCDADDADAGQPYRWAEVATDGQTGAGNEDVKLTVNKADDGDGGDCDSDVNLPEDFYSITYQEDSFDNHDDSQNGNGEDTFADNHDSADNGGSIEVASGHCMDLDDTDPDGDPEFDLREDDDGQNGVETDDDFDNPTWFPADGVDIVNNEHTMELDLDQFSPDASESGGGTNGDSDGDGHREAAGLCITSYGEYEHDNDTVDDDDSEVEGGNKDDKKIEYGNAVPINILSTS